jgi:hypothetical protein
VASAHRFGYSAPVRPQTVVFVEPPSAMQSVFVPRWLTPAPVELSRKGRLFPLSPGPVSDGSGEHPAGRARQRLRRRSDATLTQPMLAEDRVLCIQGCFDPLDVMRSR